VTRLALVSGVMLALACSKPSSESGGTAASTGVSSASPTVSSAASAASAGATPTTQSWSGSYKAVAAALTAATDGGKVRWSSLDASTGVGEGTLVVVLDSASGRATGTVDGVLGPAVLEGRLAGDQLAAAVRRKDPADRGFTGTLLGAVSGAHATGTMTVSSAEGGILRTATFDLSLDAGR
jgi:hypothetical protein